MHSTIRISIWLVACLLSPSALAAEETDAVASPAYELPGRDTGVIIRRGPAVTPTQSTAVPRIDPVTRALEIAAATPRAPAPRSTITSTRDRYVIVPQNWHEYGHPARRRAGFSLVLRDENVYLRLGDPPYRLHRQH